MLNATGEHLEALDDNPMNGSLPNWPHWRSVFDGMRLQQ